MMRRSYRLSTFGALALAAVTAAPASAQSTNAMPAGPLTLEQVLALAEARSEAIAIARAGVRRAEGDQVRARSGRLPQLSLSAAYDRALATEFEGIFGGAAAPPCPPFMPDPSASLEARVAELERAVDCGAVGGPIFGGEDEEGAELPFGRENTWRVNLQFSQMIWAGGRLGAQADLAAAGRDSAELALTSTRAQLLFDVTQAYYDAALSGRLVAIAEATVGQAEATLQVVQAGYKAGTQPEFELLRARVARDNQAPALIRQRASRDIAVLRLKQLLDLPPDADLQLAASLEAPALPPPPAFAPAVAPIEATLMQGPAGGGSGAGPPMPQRTAVREVGTIVRLRQAALAAARAERLPSIAFNSSYGRVAYPSGAFPGLDEFRTNWTVGASLQVPILTGGRIRGDEMAARAELQRSRAQLRQAEELAVLDTRSAWAELAAARAAWDASSGTIQQAVRAYEIADVRYRAGVSTQLELSDARLLLQQAEANRARAARDLQVARARIALLPDLPLAASGAGGDTTAPFTLPLPPELAQPQPGAGRLQNAAAPVEMNQPGARQ